MANCVVKDWQGEVVGSAELSLAVARPETATHLLYLALRRQLTNARQGNAHTKTRSEVRGGGRKPWKQKGTGRARAGSIRSPLWRKGGVIFGPRKREYHLDMNRKERQLALRTALQSRVEDLIVVEDFAPQLVQPKTKEVAQALLRWGVALDQSALVIVGDKNEQVERAVRNIARVKLLTIHNLNIFDLLNVDWVIITQPALESLKLNWSADKTKSPHPAPSIPASPVLSDDSQGEAS
ncbi:MAG: 50S ribosomal protein L4 [Cyanobacteriota bacterium]|nr:50S ribosomal protein L4 [Cyanobacteriota bacterium]